MSQWADQIGFGKIPTATSNTPITVTAPGRSGMNAYLLAFTYGNTTAAQPHTITAMQAASASTTSTNKIAGEGTFSLNAAIYDGGGSLAVKGDYVSVQQGNGVWLTDSISQIDATATNFTFASNLTYPANSGNIVAMYGQWTDAFHSQQYYPVAATTTLALAPGQGAMFKGGQNSSLGSVQLVSSTPGNLQNPQGLPILLQSNNRQEASTAGFLSAQFGYGLGR